MNQTLKVGNVYTTYALYVNLTASGLGHGLTKDNPMAFSNDNVSKYLEEGGIIYFVDNCVYDADDDNQSQ